MKWWTNVVCWCWVQTPLTKMSLLSQIGFAQFTPPPSTSYTRLHHKPCSSSMSSSSWTPLEDSGNKKSKKVWIWTKNKQVMTAAVERGWNTFIFPSNLPHLANDWSCILHTLSLSLTFFIIFQIKLFYY